jgi:hypothetical protein
MLIVLGFSRVLTGDQEEIGISGGRKAARMGNRIPVPWRHGDSGF